MFAIAFVGANLQRRNVLILDVSLGFWFWVSFAGLCVATAVFAVLGRWQLVFFSTAAALACGSLALGSSLLVDLSATNALRKGLMFCLAAAPPAFIGSTLLFMSMWSFASTMP